MIPKAPKLDTGYVADDDDFRDKIAHEHAVAKRAVETLKLVSVYARDEHDGFTYTELAEMAEGAVREIQASGWQP
jgi:hypothetical protein